MEFEVATTDVSSSSTARELRRIEVPAKEGRLDLLGLVAAIEQVHGIDPSQLEAEVLPAPEVSTTTLLAALDVVRGAAEAPRFPKVSLR